MPAGLVALVVVAALIFFGLAHRVLDRMRLTDGQALIFIALIIAGSFVDIPLVRAPVSVSINVGGAVIPLILAGYLLVRADHAVERVRSLVGAVITAAAVLAISSLTDFDPGRGDFLDPVWLFGIVGGVTGYLVGSRSRRASFISGTLGLLLTDVVHAVRMARTGQPATVMIGGAGAFDMIVLAGLIAVGLAEIVGEIRERLSGGPGPSSKAVGAFAGLVVLAGLLGGLGHADAAPVSRRPVPATWGERSDGRYFTLVAPDGRVVTYTALLLGKGDVYIDASNRRWKVVGIEGDRAMVRSDGVETLPEVSESALAQAQGQPGARRGRGPDVALYFTHSDESYVPTSGTSSKPWGDVYKVGETLAAELRRQGYRVVVSHNNHNPHDGQAYTRSRRTALQLLKQRPTLLVDVHRDAVPPQVYQTSVQGTPATKVRLVVGRQNQNMQANLSLARHIKAVADRIRPGLIEGIFIAQGDYNQDLAPRSILLEFGAHTNPLDLAEEGARLFAPVLPRAAGVGPGQLPSAPRGVDASGRRSATILAVAAVVAVLGFMALNAGSADELRARIRSWWRRQPVGGPGDREGP
ncbi:stage II sporulation protein P [Carboxydochorda subterranea]|uniref:Stage II sporulation protein P n=1 Tax=Carboxydichorda subterranea TaxID=3109565 RepID=A0ABZ1C145_9FIRM|nr:stage II sporulation protein P [Limnochorda sp. L945t]WRP18555.1 stage II sporulation protein P [Limnochorda sp. L945t]